MIILFINVTHQPKPLFTIYLFYQSDVNNKKPTISGRLLIIGRYRLKFYNSDFALITSHKGNRKKVKSCVPEFNSAILHEQ